MPVEVKLLPGNCSSSVTCQEKSAVETRPSERAAGGRPRLHFRPPWDQRETRPPLSLAVLSEDPKEGSSGK